jgi:uncharacterized membrane-anchored protein YjiN (DUF445 family)
MSLLRDFPSASSASEAAREGELRRVKALANGVLAGSLALLIVAKVIASRHPAFGFLAAFAEAATVGGLADWYAVVVLFRRPFGLPIPHTAIISRNQNQIADKLGEFVEEHFLDTGPVETKLRQIDFAALIADWLGDRKRSAALARFALRLLPEALEAAQSSGLGTFVSRSLHAQLQSVDLAPLASGMLRAFVAEGRHQQLLNDLLAALHGVLNKPETLAAIRQKIRAELPSLLKLYRADAFLLKKVAASGTAFLDEVRADPHHPFRGEFDQLVFSFIERLESEPTMIFEIDNLKRKLLARPEFRALVDHLWSNITTFVHRSAAAESSALQHRLGKLFGETGAQLAADPEMRAEINRGIVAAASRIIVEQKSGVATYIADQVKAWDMTRLIDLIEMNVGKDLQYIRFNGALIGGLAGVGLYAGEILLRVL